ncbi:MAG TPA: GyrI-like domain-containing protein [Edaphobacter sp.]|jgi:effector-binding domain-containing protein
MISTPEIVDVPAQKIAFIRVNTPREQIVAGMHAGLDELGRVLKAQKVSPTGPWFTHHFRRPNETFDFRICFPIDGEIQPEGRVESGELTAATVARTIYSGGYEELGKGWGEFQSWIESKNLPTRDDLWERYLVGPEGDEDSSKWRTELNRPLA